MRFSSFTVSLAAVIGLAACQPRVSVGELAQGSGGAADAADGAGKGEEPASGGAITAGGGQSSSGPGLGKSSGSGSGGDTSSGGSPDSNPVVCAPDLDHAVVQRIPDCPDEIPIQFAPCNLAENAICTWQKTDPHNGGYTAMGCYADTTGKAWSGYDGSLGGPPSGTQSELCPHTPVEPNTACDGQQDRLCAYVDETCLCDAATSTWSCKPAFSPGPQLRLPVEVERICPPVDEAKLVKDLTPAEVKAWCNWDPLSHQPPLLGPTAPPYDVTLYPVLMGGLHDNVCMPLLPPDLCEINLKIRPDCDATLAQLDDCVESEWGFGHERLVGHGCTPFLANPRCAGVQAMYLNKRGECPLPLE